MGDVISPDERLEDDQRPATFVSPEGYLPTDMSDTTESDAEKTQLVSIIFRMYLVLISFIFIEMGKLCVQPHTRVRF